MGKEAKVLVVGGRFKLEGNFHTISPNQPIFNEHGQLMGVTNPRHMVYIHMYGGEWPFFRGLTERKLLGTGCANKDCESEGTIYLPFRIHCPDCLSKNRIIDLTKRANQTTKIHTHITTERTGAFNTLDIPIHFVSVEIQDVSTILMSYLLKGEPEIGLRVRPIFRTKKPTYTITDLAWVPADLPAAELPQGFTFSL